MTEILETLLPVVRPPSQFPQLSFKRVSIVFTSVSCEEKYYYRVVSVGQLGFDCALTVQKVSKDIQIANAHHDTFIKKVSIKSSVVLHYFILHKIFDQTGPQPKENLLSDVIMTTIIPKFITIHASIFCRVNLFVYQL